MNLGENNKKTKTNLNNILDTRPLDHLKLRRARRKKKPKKKKKKTIFEDDNKLLKNTANYLSNLKNLDWTVEAGWFSFEYANTYTI